MTIPILKNGSMLSPPSLHTTTAFQDEEVVVQKWDVQDKFIHVFCFSIWFVINSNIRALYACNWLIYFSWDPSQTNKLSPLYSTSWNWWEKGSSWNAQLRNYVFAWHGCSALSFRWKWCATNERRLMTWVWTPTKHSGTTDVPMEHMLHNSSFATIEDPHRIDTVWFGNFVPKTCKSDQDALGSRFITDDWMCTCNAFTGREVHDTEFQLSISANIVS